VKIAGIFNAMFDMVPNIRAENRGDVSDYLSDMYREITTLSDAVDYSSDGSSVFSRFEGFVQSEEDRLRKNLEAIKYNVETTEIVPIITGPGRIEKVRGTSLSLVPDLFGLSRTSYRCYTFYCYVIMKFFKWPKQGSCIGMSSRYVNFKSSVIFFEVILMIYCKDAKMSVYSVTQTVLQRYTVLQGERQNTSLVYK